MIEKVKAGDKLTIIKVNSFAVTNIREITVDSIVDGRIIYAHTRKRYYMDCDNGTLILRGHNLGITRGTWGNGSCLLMDSNCNIGGLSRETMIALLKTNINEAFSQWERIYWFDGTSETGDPLFIPRPVSDNYLKYKKQAERNKSKSAAQIAVGDFICPYFKGSKHQNLINMLQTHLQVDEWSEYAQLGKVVDVINMSEKDFDSLEYLKYTNLLKDKGGSSSDDIAENRKDCSLSPLERETFYNLFTLIRTPSRRAIVVNAEGYNYMRYTGLLPHYRESMKADCNKANELLRIAEEERARKEEKKASLV